MTVSGFNWHHTTPETDLRQCTNYEMWCLSGGYRVALRGKSYDAEKNGKIIGEFAELEAAQRCVKASVERSRNTGPSEFKAPLRRGATESPTKVTRASGQAAQGMS
jgi:hypothetical protein